jgi:uncharacterized membrane protein YkoI
MRALIILSLMGGIATVPVLARADDTVSLSSTPAAVQKTIQAQVGGGQMGDITKETDGGDTIYDVDLTAKDGSDRDFSVAQDGTLLSVEVELEETPADVRKTIQTELNGGSLDSIDKNLDDTDVSYDVAGTDKGGKETSFTVDDDGTLSSREVDLTQTPDTVQKTIAAQLNGGKVNSIDEEIDDGTNFEVTVTTADGPETSFTVAADGKLTSKEVDLDSVPARARATMENRIGDGTSLRVDKSFEKRDNTFPFEVEGRKDGKPFDFFVAPRGRFLGMDN